MGADYNAGTGEELTVYHAAVLPEYQDSAVKLLGDILPSGAPRSGFRHGKAGDPRRNPDV